MAVLARYGGVLLVGLVSWATGFFGSESIKNLTWVLMALAAIALVLVAWFFLGK